MENNSDNPPGLLSPAGVTKLGLVINAALSAGKLAAGWVFASQVIFADGLHSLSDCATDVAVLAGIRISSRPADEDHPYGHRRAMTLVTAVLGLMLLGAAAFVAYRALRSFAVPQTFHIRPGVPLVLAVASVIIKEALYHLTVRVGRRVGDSSVVANAWHHRSDAASSVAAAAGLAAVALGGAKWQFLDHAVALMLCSFLLLVAVRILSQAASELMDHAPDPEVIERIGQTVASTRGVRGFHAFRARHLGGKVEMDIHVQVDPELTVREGHDIASEVRRAVIDCCPHVISVIVHIEPAQET
ncbi:MAG: hypothetical protein B1H04_01700 [Planctomycetales bacterium 4484_123]|nr:MAG: hypothetical protein B1H04_01700 [Planctomycetales bacterium 4484_123]